jgi:hypothetical protein
VGATHALAGCDDVRVQDISIVTSRPPSLYRPEGSRTVFVTFEGLRESRTASDKLTRVRVAMPAAELARLQEQIGQLIQA